MPIDIKRKRTYGTKRSAVATGSAAIFGTSPCRTPIPHRQILDEIAAQLSGVTLNNKEKKGKEFEQDEEDTSEEESEQEEVEDDKEFEESK
jgi:hypothetical protein